MILQKNKKYLQVALNSTLDEAREIIFQLPTSERILIEAGTPLIKEFGREAILKLKEWSIERILGPQKFKKGEKIDLISLIKLLSEQKKKEGKIDLKSFLAKGSKNLSFPFEPYIVADLKCMDLGKREAEIAAGTGASAATCPGLAPIETIDEFIKSCQTAEIDSMVDMMNVENPLLILRKLKKLPNVVILHRGVDETKKNKEKQIPWYQIQQVKGNYNDILVAIAGGDAIKEVRSAVFNDADIVVMWEAFYRSTEKTAELAKDFLEKIR